jgi:diadenosine tetraphosphate (Ap4A) HIT family hydrolase
VQESPVTPPRCQPVMAAALLLAFLLSLLPAPAAAQILVDHDRDDSFCPCDPARPETMELRQCSLCGEAEKQPPDALLFFLKDINPRKPNRWLALPRAHAPGIHHVSHLTPAAQRAFWKAAIERARSMWGEEWGLAVNGDKVRTQCHAHVHIGRLLEGVEDPAYLLDRGFASNRGQPVLVVATPEDIPAPRDGEAFWIHPAGKELHVHIEHRTTASEFVLMR